MHLNYPAILTATVAMFALGALWFSALFGKVWAAGLAKQGVVIAQPTTQAMTQKMIASFVINLVFATTLCVILSRMGLSGWMSGLKVGALLAVGIGAMSLANAFLWESKPLPVFFVDAGYTFVGISMMSVIIAVWH